MKKIIFRFRDQILNLFRSPKNTKPVFRVPSKGINKSLAKPQSFEKPRLVPMAKITVQTLHIPMIHSARVLSDAEENQMTGSPIEKDLVWRQRTPSLIRRPLSEKDIEALSSELKTFYGKDVRDLF